MKTISDKTVNALKALMSIVREHARGERDDVRVWTEDLSAMLGKPGSAFRDEKTLREVADWCEENGLPLLTMMLTADKEKQFYDQISCKLAFKHGSLPPYKQMKAAWIAEQEKSPRSA